MFHDNFGLIIIEASSIFSSNFFLKSLKIFPKIFKKITYRFLWCFLNSLLIFSEGYLKKNFFIVFLKFILIFLYFYEVL